MVLLPNKLRPDNKIVSVIKGQKPSCKIRFLRWQEPEITGIEASGMSDGDFVNNSTKQKLVKDSKQKMDIDNDVVSVVVSKNKNQSAGTFEIRLKRGNGSDNGQELSTGSLDYLNLIHPGDWLSVFMKKEGVITFDNSENSGLKMIGIVENVRYVEIDDPAMGRPVLEYVITGSDFGKIFENEIYFNPVLETVNIQQILGIELLNDISKRFKNTEGGISADQIAKELIEFHLGGGQDTVKSSNKVWYVPAEVSKLLGGGSASTKFTNLLDTDRIGIQKYSNGRFQGVKPLIGKTLNTTAPSSGTVWSTLQQFSNNVLNEMIVDMTIKGGKIVPSFQLRQVPYSSDKSTKVNPFYYSPHSELQSALSSSEKTNFLSLPRTPIKSTDIKQKNIGKSEFERINGICITPNIPFGANGDPITGAYVLGLNVPSIQRYGLKMIKGSTFYTIDDSAEFTKVSKKITSLLTEWFMMAHMLYNGTIITDGHNEFIEIGTNLFIDDVQQIFHIEGITHRYEVEAETGKSLYNTEFRVSRGQYVDEKVTKGSFIGSSNENPETVLTVALENIRNKD